MQGPVNEKVAGEFHSQQFIELQQTPRLSGRFRKNFEKQPSILGFEFTASGITKQQPCLGRTTDIDCYGNVSASVFNVVRVICRNESGARPSQ